MKKLLAVFALFFAFAQLTEAKPTLADCFETDLLSNSTLRITKYNCTDENVEVPSTIGGIQVEAIGPSSLQGKKLNSVILNSGIKIIEKAAFYETQLNLRW